ncbi:hypothetical protein C9374_013983 [Naegleria lovaniensis]|uniref:EGF-like domain-containing protein n=1 Tax=Naegleria lovaniensis TaxID=51637 RepID=A0AA88KPG3_NAELO|nr:uncharacterized protein C9374_013983 [Naegleria lovaniensis]KAG2389423.1 hypothetical protein C9374_013983 [Naegleria lovaniensis]
MLRVNYVALASSKTCSDRGSLIVSSCLLLLLVVFTTFTYGLTPVSNDLFYSIKTEETSGFSVEWNENTLGKNDFEPNIVVNGKLFFSAHQTINQASMGIGKKQILSLDVDGRIQVYESPVTELEDIEMMYSNGNTLYFSAKENTLFKVDITGKTTEQLSYGVLSYSKQQVGQSHVNFIKSKQFLIINTVDSATTPTTDQAIEMVYFPITVKNGGDALSPTSQPQNDLMVIAVHNITNATFSRLSFEASNTISLQTHSELLSPEKNMPFSWTSCVLFHYNNQVIAYNRDQLQYKVVINDIPSIDFHSFQNEVYIVGSHGGKLYIIRNDGTANSVVTQVTDFFPIENGFYAVDAESDVFKVELIGNNVKQTKVELTSNCANVKILTVNNENLILKCKHAMTKLNHVIRIFKDEEHSLVKDDDTSDKGGWTFFMIPLSKANIEFTLLATANTVNPKMIKFSLKPPMMCHGKNYTDPTVCNGRGKCVGENTCSCFGNSAGSACESCKSDYEGPDCQYYIIRKCFGIPFNDSTVCSGRGECVSANTCQCRHEYSGYNCRFTTCFGVSSNLTTGVCSGHGYCSDYNVCECDVAFTGPMCEISEKPQAKLYPIMITFGALSLVTVILLLTMVFCFLGKHRKEYLATYGKRTVVSTEDDDNLFLDEVEDNPTAQEKSNKKSSQNEYSLSLSDEELEVYN